MPYLNAFSMLLIVLPLSLVISSFSIFVDTVAISLIVNPLSRVNIAIYVKKLPLTLRKPELPLALVDCIVSPSHNTAAVTEATQPFSIVLRTVLVVVGFGLLNFTKFHILLDRLKFLLIKEIFTRGGLKNNQKSIFLL